VSVRITLATKEPGEPNHAGDVGGHSLWYSWTATSSNPVTFDTIGSSFDTLLAVYTGNAVNSLTLAAAMTTSPTPQTCKARSASCLPRERFYEIAVDGFALASGTVTLNWNQSVSTPLNDAFANAQVLVGNSGTVRWEYARHQGTRRTQSRRRRGRAFPLCTRDRNLQQTR